MLPQGWFDPWTQCLNMALQEHYDEKDINLRKITVIVPLKCTFYSQVDPLTVLEEKAAFFLFF